MVFDLGVADALGGHVMSLLPLPVLGSPGERVAVPSLTWAISSRLTWQPLTLIILNPQLVNPIELACPGTPCSTNTTKLLTALQPFDRGNLLTLSMCTMLLTGALLLTSYEPLLWVITRLLSFRLIRLFTSAATMLPRATTFIISVHLPTTIVKLLFVAPKSLNVLERANALGITSAP